MNFQQLRSVREAVRCDFNLTEAARSQARYALPTAMPQFRGRFPNVQLQLRQGSPQQLAQMLLEGHADVGIATEALGDCPQLVALPCFR